MIQDSLLHKAFRAQKSAVLLLQSGDNDGACSRAYYAMFDAARFALTREGFAPEALKRYCGIQSASG